MLALLVLNIFAAVIHVALTPYKTDIDIMNAMVSLRKETRAVGRGEATARDLALTTSLWGMQYTNDVALISQLPSRRSR